MSNLPARPKVQRSLLIAILLIALGLRIGWAISRPVSRDELEALPDQQQYLQIAHNVLSGEGYWFLDPRVADKVYAFRMPGYPLFIAACGANVRIVRIVQAVLDASSVWAAYLLAMLLFPSRTRNRVALLAAALLTFNPFLIYFCGLILSETVFVAMMLWSMVLLVAGQASAERKSRTLLWLAGGLLVALSVLVRPSAIALPVVLGIAAAFVNRKRGDSYHLRWPLPVGTTMLIWLIVVLTPWAARNNRVLHQWIWLDTNSGFTFYDGYNPDATGASDQRFVKDMPQLRRMDEVERSRYLQNLAIDWGRNHPRRVADLMRARLVRMWSPVPLSDQYSGRLYQLVGLCFSLPLDLLILWGVLNADLGRAGKVFLLIPAIYLSGIHMLTVGSLRYRLPAEPPMALLAAGGLVGTKRTVNGE